MPDDEEKDDFLTAPLENSARTTPYGTPPLLEKRPQTCLRVPCTP